jgi:hypothetical protein
VGLGPHVLERLSCLALAKPETTQRSKGLRVRFRDAGFGNPAVATAVGVSKAQARRNAPFN